MLVKGAFVSQMSGSVGGLTASHNASGTYLRARVVPVNPNTTFQQTVRNIAGNLSTAWVTSLSAAQRAAWDLYGDNVAMTNRVGDTIFLTGLNHFLRSNTPRIQAGLSRIDDAPTIFALTDVTLPAITVAESDQEADLAFDNTDAWAIADDGFLALALSRPQNRSINYFKGPYRFAGVVLGAVAPPVSPEAIAVPFPVVENQRVFGLCRGALADGRLSQPIRIFDDVSA